MKESKQVTEVKRKTSEIPTRDEELHSEDIPFLRGGLQNGVRLRELGTTPLLWLSPRLEMAADRVRCGYPQVSVFLVSGLVLVFRPRFSGSGLGLVSGSVLGFGFHPWISNGYPN